MEEYDWTILSKIGEHKSISQVSEELFTTQPALTYRINKLEKQLGSPLFIRTNKGLKPNNQGEYLIKYANKMLAELKHTKEQILSLASETKGKLYIGATSAVAQHILPKLLSDFLDVHPNVEPNVITGFTPHLLDMLSKENIHIAFLREDIEWLNFKSKIRSEDIFIVSKNPIKIKDLPSFSRIDYKTNQSLKLIIDTWWTQNFNNPPKITSTVDNADVCLEFVRSGLGYAILTGLCLTNENSLYRVPLKNKNKNIERGTWLYATKDSEDYFTVKSFIEFIQTNYVIE